MTFSIRGRWTGNNHSINSGLSYNWPTKWIAPACLFYKVLKLVAIQLATLTLLAMNVATAGYELASSSDADAAGC